MSRLKPSPIGRFGRRLIHPTMWRYFNVGQRHYFRIQNPRLHAKRSSGAGGLSVTPASQLTAEDRRKGNKAALLELLDDGHLCPGCGATDAPAGPGAGRSSLRPADRKSQRTHPALLCLSSLRLKQGKFETAPEKSLSLKLDVAEINGLSRFQHFASQTVQSLSR